MGLRCLHLAVLPPVMHVRFRTKAGCPQTAGSSQMRMLRLFRTDSAWRPKINISALPSISGSANQHITGCGEHLLHAHQQRLALNAHHTHRCIAVFAPQDRLVTATTQTLLSSQIYLAIDPAPSQLKNVTVLRPVPSYTAWWQRHIGVNNLPKVVMLLCPNGNWTHDLLIASRTPYCYATRPPPVVLFIDVYKRLSIWWENEVLVHCCVAVLIILQ